MTGFLGIRTFVIADAVAQKGQAHLRAAGRRGLEGFVLWAGRAEVDVFRVTEAIVPEQTGHRTEHGVYVQVDGPALHRLNVYLYESGLRLCAQVHSHPGEAYHSETDDAFAIATAIGSLSVVVPDFARGPFQLARSAVYRLLSRGWTALSASEVAQLIRVEA
jgi:proteasome lid subunit RPN8/RPN11